MDSGVKISLLMGGIASLFIPFLTWEAGDLVIRLFFRKQSSKVWQWYIGWRRCSLVSLIGIYYLTILAITFTCHVSIIREGLYATGFPDKEMLDFVVVATIVTSVVTGIDLLLVWIRGGRKKEYDTDEWRQRRSIDTVITLYMMFIGVIISIMHIIQSATGDTFLLQIQR